jgi:hypothetical protein
VPRLLAERFGKLESLGLVDLGTGEMGGELLSLVGGAE